MAKDEENKNVEETEENVENAAEDAAVENAPENDAAVENAAEDSSSSAGPAGEESSAAPADASESVSEAEGEEEEKLSPSAARKKAKAARNRKPKFSGTWEERRAQRDAHRKKKAVQRRAHRAKQREAHKAGGPRQGTPPAEKTAGTKKIQQGTVVSSRADKTITIEIEVMEAHRMYKKIVRHSKKLTAHDEQNDANEGDVVRVVESRPLSRTKRWRLVEVVERAK